MSDGGCVLTPASKFGLFCSKTEQCQQNTELRPSEESRIVLERPPPAPFGSEE